MPHQMWRHVCAAGREEVWGSPACSTCGVRGVFDGWYLGMWESVRVYKYVYGLNPFGPHRPLADRLLVPMRDVCVRCGGRAVLTIDEETWRRCPTCEGTGGVWNRPFDEIDAVWRRVVAEWPEAVLPSVYARARLREWHDPAGKKSSRRSANSRRKGYSSHGLSFDEVRRAFAEAERLLGATWQLKGRGHCRRVSLDARYSPHALSGAARSWAWVTPHESMSPRRLLPLAIVEKAAEILGVQARLLISREF